MERFVDLHVARENPCTCTCRKASVFFATFRSTEFGGPIGWLSMKIKFVLWVGAGRCNSVHKEPLPPLPLPPPPPIGPLPHMAWPADMQSRWGSHRVPPQASCEP